MSGSRFREAVEVAIFVLFIMAAAAVIWDKASWQIWKLLARACVGGL